MNQMELSFNARIENEPFARTSVASGIKKLLKYSSSLRKR